MYIAQAFNQSDFLLQIIHPVILGWQDWKLQDEIYGEL